MSKTVPNTAYEQQAGQGNTATNKRHGGHTFNVHRVGYVGPVIVANMLSPGQLVCCIGCARGLVGTTTSAVGIGPTSTTQPI